VGLARLNVWVSDVADPCGTFKGAGTMTILDCHGVLEWPCGRFLTPDGKWVPVPGGAYHDLPFRCGHLEVELPPGCYWVVAGYVGPPIGGSIHFNYTTHVGIVEVGCDETACVKLFNPTIRLCWDWFHAGLRVLAAAGGRRGITAGQLKEIENVVGGVLKDVPTLPIEETVEQIFDSLVKSAGKQR
jgi:hypothetical protein